MNDLKIVLQICYWLTNQLRDIISYSLGPRMEYSHISWIQRIETCISRGAAEWNTRFQWVEWRKYDYISWVDQVNNFWTPQASNCPLFSLKNCIKVTPQMKRLVNMNLVFITYTNIFEKLVNIIPIFHTLSCIYHLVIKTFKKPHISQYQENIWEIQRK